MFDEVCGFVELEIHTKNNRLITLVAQSSQSS